MTEPKQSPCLKCGFLYDRDELESCPQCHHHRFTSSFLRALSETTVKFPFGAKTALFLIMNTAIFKVGERFFHSWWITLSIVLLYDLGFAFWVNKKKDLEPSIYLIILLFLLFLPIFLLVALLVF